ALYLATLSLSSQRAEGVRRPEFSGADRLIADYLWLEVLSELSPDELALLRRTAFLDRVGGPLADSILNAKGSGLQLESLAERTGLLIPDDLQSAPPRGGRCFRFHNVLRELLLSELDREEPELVPTLA